MEIAVVGAGVFGAWTALLLSRAGHEVTLLDREGPANEKSSSAGESRIIRSAYGPDEIYTIMARRSLPLWRQFFREENCQNCFRNTGVLWMAKPQEPSIQQARAIFDRLRITYDWLDTEAIAERYPHFELERDTVALFEPDAGALLAERSVQALVTAALRSGVRYEAAEIKPPVLNHSRLRSIEATDGRRFSADYFVFACGSWLPKIFDALQDMIRPTRQNLFFFAIPEGVDQLRPDLLPVWIDQTEPRMAYGFPDLGSGLKIGFHRLGPAFDPDMPRHATRTDEISAAADFLGQRLPAMRGAQLKATHICHYENTPNGDFLVDLHPGSQNVWLVGGGSGHGFKHAPAIAEYVLNAITGAGYREVRFSLAAKQDGIARRVL
jgi:sarcosine oxidase